MTKGVLLTERAAAKTAGVVGKIHRRVGGDVDRRRIVNPPPGTRYWGILLDNLENPDDPMTSPTSAQVQILKRSPNPDSNDLVEDDGNTVLVVNRDPTLTTSIGALCKIEYLSGEWSFYWIGCPGAGF